MTNIYYVYLLWESPMPSGGSAVAFGAGLVLQGSRDSSPAWRSTLLVSRGIGS
jgi:hypothetical protein